MLVAGSALDGSSMGRDVVIIRPWLLLWVEVRQCLTGEQV